MFPHREILRKGDCFCFIYCDQSRAVESHNRDVFATIFMREQLGCPFLFYIQPRHRTVPLCQIKITQKKSF